MITLDEVDKLYLSLITSGTNEFELQEKEKLYEKVYDINSHDVNLIIPYLRDYFDSLNGLNYFDIAKEAKPKLLQIIPSGELTSPECKSAHIMNPIQIRVYSICQSRYAPKSGYIQIGFPSFLTSVLLGWIQTPDFNGNFTGSIDLILNHLSILDKNKAYIKNFLTLDAIKQTWYHELSHWLTDSIDDQHIRKSVDNAERKKKSLAQHYKVSDMVFSPIELDAYMNGIYATYKLLGKEKWDTLTINDLFDVYPALQTIENDKDKGSITQFKKNLILRLNREELLGKNMH